MPTCDRLLVLWSGADGARHIVGELWREAPGYAFGYRDDLSAERAAGFSLLPEFPEHRTIAAPYRWAYLFATFAQRIPSPKRPDYRRILESWGVEGCDDQLEILARSGGVQMTDRIELAEHRRDDDDLSRALLFRVAGTKHYQGAEHVRAGDPVSLVREPQNQWDSSATLVVLARGDHTLGHVPRQYSGIFAKLLDAGRTIDAIVERELVIPDSQGRWVVRAQRR